MPPSTVAPTDAGDPVEEDVPVMFWIGALIVVAPWVVAVSLAVWLERSGLAVLAVLLGIGVGAIAVLVTGFDWATRFNPEAMNSQAIGFITVPVILPYLAYCGAIAGGFWVVFCYRQPGYGANLAWLALVARLLGGLFTAYLAGVIPALLLVSGGQGGESPSIAEGTVWHLGGFVLGLTGSGALSAWAGTRLATGAVELLIQWRGY